MPRTLRAGDRGPDVLALQQALHKALGGKARNNRKGVYGSQTTWDVQLFKSLWSKDQDGHLAGALVWSHLEKYLGVQQRRLLRRAQALERAREAESAEQRIRGAIVAEAYWALANNGRFTYRQFRPYPPSLRVPEARDRVDCSSFVTLCYKAAGAIDPNGRSYDGQGYTGTLVSRGTPVASPGPTDLCFYGSMGGGIPSHVAICVEPGWVVSDGHTPVSKYPVRYRTVVGVRCYPVV